MTRHARCLCGQLSIALTGEPFAVLLCNCTDCQRRTGSVYGVGAYFTGEQIVAQVGETRRYTKVAASGRPVQFHFCPTCATTLCWTAPDAPLSEGVGVAVGCFNDRDFPPPVLAAWCVSKVGWVPLPAGVAQAETQPASLPGLL